MNLIAFHGDLEIKKKYLERVNAHAKADEIIKGNYWENGKGCAVGCTIHSGNHADYETELAIPEWLARLEDFIFENLPNDTAKEWPGQFLEAIPVGASNWNHVYHSFAHWLLVDPQAGVIRYRNTWQEPYKERVIEAIEQVAEYHLNPSESAARSAELAARSAESAAWSAWSAGGSAESAARSAESAARSARAAARSAAWAAAWSAAESAWSAAESAWSAARSAESAARSAESAAWSAWSAAVIQQSEKLLELLRAMQ